MILLQVAFWLGACFVLYTYAVYPLILMILARLLRRDRILSPCPHAVTVVISARNEENSITSRIAEFLSAFDRGSLDGELVIVSDGSTDRTVANARQHLADAESTAPCRVLELPGNVGKASALSAGCELATKPILAFADTRQTWAPDALNRLLENFADPQVGAVSGDLVIANGADATGGVGLYWKYEKWLRVCESRVWSMVGATGSISAVRRELFHPIPPGTILDDVYWPLRVAMSGYRVIHDQRALAFDRLPPRTRDEFKRKVRTLGGNLQLAFRMPNALLPWSNPIWAQFLSHKLFRLLVPWVLLAMFAVTLILHQPVYRVALWSQICFYSVAVLGLRPRVARAFRPVSAASSFLILNAAAFTAWFVWFSGRTGRSWTKTSYPPRSAAGIARSST